ncbi:hypothetical protein HDU91_006093, partial [Kappamyces sp. JEL0680]
MPNNSANPIPPPGSHPPVILGQGAYLHETCKTPGDFALGFDDGVSVYDSSLLPLLKAQNVIATFFINGYNWNDVTKGHARETLLRIQSEGHQIA